MIGDDLIEELEDWAEIGWVLLDCGCLANLNGMAFHGSVEGHLADQAAAAVKH